MKNVINKNIILLFLLILIIQFIFILFDHEAIYTDDSKLFSAAYEQIRNGELTPLIFFTNPIDYMPYGVAFSFANLLLFSNINLDNIIYSNHAIIILISLIWMKIFQLEKIKFYKTIAILITLNPALNFYSNFILKDVQILFFLSIVIYFYYLNKYQTNKFKSIIYIAITIYAVFLGTISRPYFIFLMMTYYLFVKYIRNEMRDNLKNIFSLLLIFFIIIYYSTSQIKILYDLKMIALSTMAFILSPNIGNIDNWVNFQFMTFISLVKLIIIYLGLIFQPVKVLKILVCLFIIVLPYGGAACLPQIQLSNHDDNLFATNAGRTGLAVIPIVTYMVLNVLILNLKYLKSIYKIKLKSL